MSDRRLALFLVIGFTAVALLCIGAVAFNDADERLTWALGVLGIDFDARLPEWILAAYYS